MERNQRPSSALDEQRHAAMSLLLVAVCALAPSFGNGGCGGGSTGSEQARSLQSVDTCTVWLESPQSSLRATVRDRQAVVSDGGRGTTPLMLEGGGQMMMGRRHMGVIRGNAAEDLPQGQSVRRRSDGRLDAFVGRSHVFTFSAARACSPTNALLGGSALLFEALPRYSP